MFQYLRIKPLAKVTSKKKLAHSLIGVLAPCQGHGSEFFFVFHVSYLTLVWPASYINFHFGFLSRWYFLDRIGESVIVSDRNQTWSHLSKREAFQGRCVSWNHQVAEMSESRWASGTARSGC